MSVESAGIHAAGGVLWRRNDEGTVHIALVHRPRYGDWSLPKGKMRRGETTPRAAAREILEETGFPPVLGRRLGTVHYQVSKPADNNDPHYPNGPNSPNGTDATDATVVTKTVDYFSAAAGNGEFVPGREVDQLRWVSPTAAESWLSRAADVEIVRAFTEFPPELSTVLLIRHADAGKAGTWPNDAERPLSDKGWRQEAALRALIPVFGPTAAFAAPVRRCLQTVQGIADDLGVLVHHEPALSEPVYSKDPVLGIDRLLDIVQESGRAVIVSQGAVIPRLVSTLADAAPAGTLAQGQLSAGVGSNKKGSLWLLSFSPAQHGQPPQLVAADYYSSALATPSTGSTDT